jgi:hypothetical protein
MNSYNEVCSTIKCSPFEKCHCKLSNSLVTKTKEVRRLLFYHHKAAVDLVKDWILKTVQRKHNVF